MLRDHWNKVYQSKAPEDVSWYQAVPRVSLEMIAASGVSRDTGIIDVGGGASTLVDHLLEQGYTALTVLDVSAEALARSRARLGDRASAVTWLESDVTTFEPLQRYGLWHDRAVFHFLISDAERRAYVQALRRTLEPGGTVIIATFALDGPEKCSGLEVKRHDETSLLAELGADFQLREVRRETHVTPWQSEQKFIYVRCARSPA
jgi:SAM-dependent methyltransferase